MGRPAVRSMAFETEQLERQRKDITEEQGQLDNQRKQTAADANKRIQEAEEREQERAKKAEKELAECKAKIEHERQEEIAKRKVEDE